MFIFWLSLEENRNFRVMDGEALLAFINPRDYRIFRIKEWVQFGLFFDVLLALFVFVYEKCRIYF